MIEALADSTSGRIPHDQGLPPSQLEWNYADLYRHANFCAVDGIEKSLKRTKNDVTVSTLSLCSMPISILKSHAQRNLEGSWRVIAVAVTPDGRRAVSASRDGTLKVWDGASGNMVCTFDCDRAAQACAIGRNGRVYIAGDETGRVHVLLPEGTE